MILFPYYVTITFKNDNLKKVHGCRQSFKELEAAIEYFDEITNKDDYKHIELFHRLILGDQVTHYLIKAVSKYD